MRPDDSISDGIVDRSRSVGLEGDPYPLAEPPERYRLLSGV
jgi:hypothetical protein